MLATTPSGSWAMRSRMPPSVEHRPRRPASPRPRRGRSRCGRASRSARCATGVMRLADLGGERRRQRLELGDDGGAKARDGSLALAERPWPPTPAARRARARALAATLGGVVGGHLGDRLAGRRVDDLQGRGSCGCRRGACRARGSRRGAARSSSVPVAGAVELGVPLHRGHEARRRACGSPRSCRRPGSAPRRRSPAARSLMRLVVDAVDRGPRRALEELGQARARRRTRPRGGCGRRSPRRGAAPARAAAWRCPGSSVPPNATLIICRPRQMPSTGLPRVGEGGEQLGLVVVADRVALPALVAAAPRRSCAGAHVGAALRAPGRRASRRSGRGATSPLLRVARRARDHHRQRAARHHPVRASTARRTAASCR